MLFSLLQRLGLKPKTVEIIKFVLAELAKGAKPADILLSLAEQYFGTSIPLKFILGLLRDLIAKNQVAERQQLSADGRSVTMYSLARSF